MSLSPKPSSIDMCALAGDIIGVSLVGLVIMGLLALLGATICSMNLVDWDDMPTFLWVMLIPTAVLMIIAFCLVRAEAEREEMADKLAKEIRKTDEMWENIRKSARSANLGGFRAQDPIPPKPKRLPLDNGGLKTPRLPSELTDKELEFQLMGAEIKTWKATAKMVRDSNARMGMRD